MSKVTTYLIRNDMIVYKYPNSNIPTSYDFSAYTSGNAVQRITVPITFGPMEKDYLARTENHEYIASATDTSGYTQVEAYGQRYYVQLPRMALSLNGIAYNSQRSYGSNEWAEYYAELVQARGSQFDQLVKTFQPTPYDFNYTLYIATDSMDYISQILENILPYFNPKLFLRVKEFSFLNVERDLPVSIDGVQPEFISNEIPDDDRRYVNATLNLTVEAYMYRPFEYDKIIKIIKSQYLVIDYNNPSVVSATSADDYSTSALNGYIVSADSFSTSGVKMTSAGDIPTSAIPETYSFSGSYEDDVKDFYYFTSADTNEI